MVKQQQITRTPPQRKLVITQIFRDNLDSIAENGATTFGERVSSTFVEKVVSKIAFLSKMSDINPKSRFIESTQHKTYRNILIEKYVVLYSVTSRTIRIINIYHQHINPVSISKMKNL
ncbi:MAG: type II toxin-antitoxin system RelE/ParE family toxin [Paludibacter sp.]|jgi:plasmid stabilization system protein ParE|nr:type II toxin-antitoxin system RelE/ParE family toxin [Paludibacter sp.]